MGSSLLEVYVFTAVVKTFKDLALHLGEKEQVQKRSIMSCHLCSPELV